MSPLYINQNQFKELFLNNYIDEVTKQKIACLMLRINITTAIQNAGSGHLGTSLSVLEIMLSSLMFLNKFPKENTHFFSSKGHDVPALYACYEALGILDDGELKKLRKFNGLPGHPDVQTSRIIFNTGSLGMGISKANGWLSSQKLKNTSGKIILVIGDGEFQEGQNFEALMYLQNNLNLKPLIIMDHNKIQSDTWVERVKSFEPLNSKISSFGINFEEIDGHDIKSLNFVIDNHFSKNNDRATFIKANTVKGKGITFAEEKEFRDDLELYNFHSGTMDEKLFFEAMETFKKNLVSLTQDRIKIQISKQTIKKIIQKTDHQSNLLNVYREKIINVFKDDKNIALNADLVKDAGSLEIKRRFPNQFYEFGIAEQDMVSFASGLSSGGFIPWCHSFACFLTTRAQEQIFNYCSERRKGVFIGALAGPVPASPGHSHQMIRDVAIMSNMPFLKVIEPLTDKMVKDFINSQSTIKENIYLRLTNANLNLKSYSNLGLPKQGHFVQVIPKNENTTKILVIQGPVLLSEAISVIDKIKALKNVAVYGAVWLNEISVQSLKEFHNLEVFVFEGSNYFGDFGSLLSVKFLENNIKIAKFKRNAINDLPECGDDDLVLKHHKLSGVDMLESVS